MQEFLAKEQLRIEEQVEGIEEAFYKLRTERSLILDELRDTTTARKQAQ